MVCSITWWSLPSLFKHKGPRKQDGPAPGGVLDSDHRNTLENIQTSSSEPLCSDA